VRTASKEEIGKVSLCFYVLANHPGGWEYLGGGLHENGGACFKKFTFLTKKVSGERTFQENIFPFQGGEGGLRGA